MFPNEENIVPDSESIYKSQLEKMIFGYMKNLKINSKVMIMGLDAATTGRLSIAMYSELEGSRFFENIKKWHSDISWIQFDYKQKCNSVNSFSLYEIAKCAYGTEQNGELKCKSEILTDTVLRLIPCITEGRKLPKDIMRSLFVRASNPLAYEKGYNHRLVLETACGVIRKYYLDNGKGVISMAIDYKDKPRSYLFGCLLAIADKAESDTYEKEERGKRITNVKRYWNKFVSYPYREPKANESDIMQLAAQGMCLEDMLCCKVPFGYLFYGETKKRVKVEMTSDLRNRTKSTIEEMHVFYKRKHTHVYISG